MPALLLPRFTPKEQIIFEVLERAAGRPVSAESLQEVMYQAPFEPPQCWRSVLKVLLCRMRKKLATAGDDREIRAEWGRGYRMDRR
jgi:DNA-binding response OmpR family regulator